MVNTTTSFKTAISASTRRVKAKVELYKGSTLVNTFTQEDAIKSIDIERVGEDSKFFGFGVLPKKYKYRPQFCASCTHIPAFAYIFRPARILILKDLYINEDKKTNGIVEKDNNLYIDANYLDFSEYDGYNVYYEGLTLYINKYNYQIYRYISTK